MPGVVDHGRVRHINRINRRHKFAINKDDFNQLIGSFKQGASMLRSNRNLGWRVAIMAFASAAIVAATAFPRSAAADDDDEGHQGQWGEQGDNGGYGNGGYYYAPPPGYYAPPPAYYYPPAQAYYPPPAYYRPPPPAYYGPPQIGFQFVIPFR